MGIIIGIIASIIIIAFIVRACTKGTAKATAEVITTTNHMVHHAMQAPTVVRTQAPVVLDHARNTMHDAIHSDTTARTLAKGSHAVHQVKWQYAKAHVRTKRGVKAFISEVKANMED